MLPSEAFRSERAAGRTTLVGYLPVGYPTVDAYGEAVGVMAAGGFRVLEIGVPPAARGLDGAVIEKAMAAVEKTGIDLHAGVALGADAAARHGLAPVAMLYSPLLRRVGASALFGELRSSGVGGILVPDLPPSEWLPFAAEAVERGLEPVGFIPADADEGTVARIAEAARGFLYVQSYAGRTGSAFGMSESLRARVALVTAIAAERGIAVAVGFGLRTAADVAAVRGLGAAGAVIGTALVDAAGRGRATLERFVGGFSVTGGAAAWKH